MKLTSSRTVLAFASVALLVGAAACGGDDDNSSSATTAAAASATTAAAPTTAEATTTTAAATTTTAAATTTTAGAAGGGTATTAAGGAAAAPGPVAIADSSLGKILVDSKGMTLYLFTPDNQGPSVCTGKCLAAWPSVPGPATAGTGVDASKLGTATRPDDGQVQATYGGWPLYTFVQDQKPGDVTGQGSGGKWYVIGADGNKIDND